MKRSSLKSITEAAKNVLNSTLSDDKLRFEAFFRGAALRYIAANKLQTDKTALSEAFPDIFPRLTAENAVISASERVCQILDEIPDETWKSNVQLIGRLYQYFNSAAA